MGVENLQVQTDNHKKTQIGNIGNIETKINRLLRTGETEVPRSE